MASSVINLRSPQAAVMPVTFTIAASAAVNSSQSGVMAPYGVGLSTASNFVVPSNEKWVLVDYYVNASLTTDLQPAFIVNGLQNPLAFTANSTIVTNSARFRLPTPIEVLPNQTLQINAYILAAAPTTTSTETCYAVWIRAPVA